MEFDIPYKTFVPLDDAHLAFDSSPRKPVPIGPNHQAVIPVWKGRVNKASELGKYNSNDSPYSHLGSFHAVNDNEERLMGTSVLSLNDSSFYSSMGNKGGEGRTECNCLDQGSIRCVRQHVREAREDMRKTLGEQNFVNLGFCDMGEDVALRWTEEEEFLFHELVYSNPASLGRNFWKHLSATFHSRTNKEIVSYYFNVFMLRRRAAQNRARFLDIDSDDDECPTRNAKGFGIENSEDDSAVESLGDQDVHVEDQDNYSDEDGSDNGNSDDGTDGNVLGLTGYDMGNTTEGRTDQRSSKCKASFQVESWSNPIQHVDGTLGILNDGIGVQDDSCMSFECGTNMDVSCYSHELVDASSALQAKGFKCDQSPRMHAKPDLSSDDMEHVYFLEPCDAKEWYPGYSTCTTTDVDFLPTSNLIEEFFGPGTPNKKTTSD